MVDSRLPFMSMMPSIFWVDFEAIFSTTLSSMTSLYTGSAATSSATAGWAAFSSAKAFDAFMVLWVMMDPFCLVTG